MNLTISINEKEYILHKDEDNLYSFFDEESDNKLRFFDDGIVIKRRSLDHDTIISLRQNWYIRVISECGNLDIAIKMVEKYKNNDIFIYAYEIDGKIVKVLIKGLGE